MARTKRPENPPPTPPGPPAAARKGRCARCSREFLFTTIDSHKSFPFCTSRCRDVDLGNWMTGKYTISTPLLPHQLEDEDTDQNPNSGEDQDLDAEEGSEDFDK